MKLTEKILNKLIKASGGACPNCGSTDYEIVSSFTTNISGSSGDIKRCKVCGCEWRTYTPRNGLPVYDGIVKRGKLLRKFRRR